MRLHKENEKLEAYLHSNFEIFPEGAGGEGAQNANLERWTEGHTYTPRASYGWGAARCRGGGAYLLTSPDHTLLKEALKRAIERLARKDHARFNQDDILLVKAVTDWVIQDMIKLKAAQDMNEVSALYLQGARDMVRLGRVALEVDNDDKEGDL